MVPALVAIGLAALLGEPAAEASPAAAVHGVVDTACKGGAGVGIPSPASPAEAGSEVATTMLPSGVSIVVVSAGFPTAAVATVHAFTPGCVPDTSFGQGGSEQLSYEGRDFTINAAAPAVGGGLVLAGQTNSADQIGTGWLVAHLGPSGRLDPSFGVGGWAELPWSGGASAVDQEPSGRIVFAGTQGSGCCEHEWVGELSPRGALVSGFGIAGRTSLTVTRDDSGAGQVAVEPDGEILVVTGGGNMGCWGVTVSALTASGSPVPSFQQHFNAAMGAQTTFVGSLVVHDGGFLLAGTGQAGCVENAPSPTAVGRIIAFGPSGGLDRSFGTDGQVRFSSPMEDPVWALAQQDGGLLVAGVAVSFQPNAQSPLTLNLLRFSAKGHLDPGYGHGGVAELQLQHLSPSAAITNGRLNAVVCSSTTRNAFWLTELLG
ncbi:MAG: hypothetical protein ABSE77_02790 [Acidimicrobiales bacterium]